MDIEEALERFKCPVCFEIPPENIFQCKNGHTLCHHCRPILELCPVCRIPFGNEKIRNLQIEFVLSKMQFPCVNAEEGCHQQFHRKDLQQHQKICKFGLVSLCKLMGFKCSFESDFKQVESIVAHLQTIHAALILPQSKSATQVRLDFKQLSTTKLGPIPNSIWTPIILKMEGGRRTHLVLSHVNGSSKTISWTCFSLTPEEEKCSEVEFSIGSECETESLPALKWKQPCGRYTHAEKLLTGKPFQVPISYLDENFVREESFLEVRISLGKNSFQESSTVPLEEEEAVDDEQLVLVRYPAEYKLESRPIPSLGGDDHKIWHEWTCIICAKVSFRGNAFVCLQCANICFCKDCFSPSTHAQHIFALVRTDEQYELLYRQSYGVGNVLLSHVVPDAGLHDWVKGNNTAIFEGTRCHNCERNPISGTRLKCLQCGDYDLCELCASSGLHSHHIFGVITNSHQNNLITGLARERSPLIQ